MYMQINRLRKFTCKQKIPLKMQCISNKINNKKMKYVNT